VSAAHSHHSYGAANDCANGSSNIGDGKEFTDRRFGLRKRAATGKHELDTLCSELGIDHRLTPP
jgi:DNA polymerase III epsilon subunit-like protein